MLLRLGCALVAWMVLYTHCIWLATLSVTGCADGDHLWRLLLGFAPFTLGFCLLLNVSRRLIEVHRILVWLSVPLVVVIPLALHALWPTLQTATLSGDAICIADSAPGWHFWWAPVQLIVIAGILVAVGFSWRLRTPVRPAD